MNQKKSDPMVLWIGIDPYRFPGYREAGRLMDVVERAGERFPPGTVEIWLFGPDDDLDVGLARRLSEQRWRCVMIGQGVRVGVVPTETFERIVNLIRVHAPDAAIAFNETIYDGLEAASRWVDELATKRP